jgi:hypothetical protein
MTLHRWQRIHRGSLGLAWKICDAAGAGRTANSIEVDAAADAASRFIQIASAAVSPGTACVGRELFFPPLTSFPLPPLVLRSCRLRSCYCRSASGSLQACCIRCPPHLTHAVAEPGCQRWIGAPDVWRRRSDLRGSVARQPPQRQPRVEPEKSRRRRQELCAACTTPLALCSALRALRVKAVPVYFLTLCALVVLPFPQALGPRQ